MRRKTAIGKSGKRRSAPRAFSRRKATSSCAATATARSPTPTMLSARSPDAPAKSLLGTDVRAAGGGARRDRAPCRRHAGARPENRGARRRALDRLARSHRALRRRQRDAKRRPRRDRSRHRRAGARRCPRSGGSRQAAPSRAFWRWSRTRSARRSTAFSAWPICSATRRWSPEQTTYLTAMKTSGDTLGVVHRGNARFRQDRGRPARSRGAAIRACRLLSRRRSSCSGRARRPRDSKSAVTSTSACRRASSATRRGCARCCSTSSAMRSNSPNRRRVDHRRAGRAAGRDRHRRARHRHRHCGRRSERAFSSNSSRPTSARRENSAASASV